MRSRPQTHFVRGQARRALVIDAAIELIAERGIEGVSHRSVAARAGVPAATPGYYFASIDELIGAAISHVAAEILGTVEDCGLHDVLCFLS